MCQLPGRQKSDTACCLWQREVNSDIGARCHRRAALWNAFTGVLDQNVCVMSQSMWEPLVPHPFVITNIHAVNESSSGGKPYIGGSIRQNECPSGTKTNNIHVQLLLTSGPFLASQHQDNSIFHIFLTSSPYILFFSFFFSPQPNPPRNGWTDSV